ncbi:hypothetical protein ANTQUA_LOCUS571 [Anthophora quadrimaculata]
MQHILNTSTVFQRNETKRNETSDSTARTYPPPIYRNVLHIPLGNPPPRPVTCRMAINNFETAATFRGKNKFSRFHRK